MTRTKLADLRANSRQRLLTALLAGTAILSAGSAFAQTIPQTQAPAADDADQVDEIIVTGIRASLQNALQQKREADNLVEVIEAEDIGKLPDQNLAEVLENVTGIQITREAGVGRGVQIRGTDANRVEINGRTFVGPTQDATPALETPAPDFRLRPRRPVPPRRAG